MLHPIVRLGLVATLAASASGCLGGTACTAVLIYGLNVTVVDATTQARLCDAQVVARDGAYSETLTLQPGSPCTYVGAGERPGAYTLTATQTGYATITRAAPAVVRDESGCHVLGVSYTISLTHT